MTAHRLAFYYGFRLTENDFKTLLKHTKKFAPSQDSGLSEEEWYFAILNQYCIEEIIREIQTLTTKPLRIEFINPRDYGDMSSYFCLCIDETFHLQPDLDERPCFDLRPVPEWDSQLQGFCRKYGIPWPKPYINPWIESYTLERAQYHLHLDYWDEEFFRTENHGAFFYGLKVATYRDWWTLVQKIIECDGEVFFIKDERGHEKYDPFYIMYYYKYLTHTSVRQYPAWSARWSDADFEKAEADNPDSVFGYPKLDKIDPEKAKDLILEECYLRDLIFDLDTLWKSRREAVTICQLGRWEGSVKGSIYLAIRSTEHLVDIDGDNDSFDLPEKNSDEWDRLLHDKCIKYGFSWTPPSYCLLIE